jgi:beta-lactamase class A
MRRQTAWLALTILAVLFGVAGAWARAQDQDVALGKLEREIGRLAKEAGGTVGISAIHIESGRKISLHGNERFPMASMFKVPVAVQLLDRVDRGDISLDQMIELKPSDLHPGSGILTDLFSKPGVALSIRNLLELTMLISDNSAADLCLRLAGGPEAVTKRMREIGIADIDVNRSTALLISDHEGAELPPESEWNAAIFDPLYEKVPVRKRLAAAERFDVDRRDTASPDAMRTLLERIYSRTLLKAPSAELLLDMMSRCQTGNARLKGMLPAGVDVAHKTGTIGGTTNDAGIITLPDAAGHIAIVVLMKSSTRDSAIRERTIAHIARAIYDFFLFN